MDIQTKLERAFNKFSKLSYYYGDRDLIRYFIFQLTLKLEDLDKIEYELRFANFENLYYKEAEKSLNTESLSHLQVARKSSKII